MDRVGKGEKVEMSSHFEADTEREIMTEQT